MKKYKLGASYNLFNGEELLKKSLLSIRNQVDYINVVWQDFSWTMEQADAKLEELLESLKKEGLIDKVIKFTYAGQQNPTSARCRKGNVGVRDLKRAKCTHFILMDVDEFYFEDEFKKAKEFVFENRITHSVCSIYDYRVLPCYRMRDARDYCVGFIFKMTLFSLIVGRPKVNRMPCSVDSYRTVPLIPIISKFYYLNCICMHHMTGIRKNYTKKMSNTLSNYSESGKEAIKYYTKLQSDMEAMSENEIINSGYIKVDDNFDIMDIDFERQT